MGFRAARYAMYGTFGPFMPQTIFRILWALQYLAPESHSTVWDLIKCCYKLRVLDQEERGLSQEDKNRYRMNDPEGVLMRHADIVCTALELGGYCQYSDRILSRGTELAACLDTQIASLNSKLIDITTLSESAHTDSSATKQYSHRDLGIDSLQKIGGITICWTGDPNEHLMLSESLELSISWFNQPYRYGVSDTMYLRAQVINLDCRLSNSYHYEIFFELDRTLRFLFHASNNREEKAIRDAYAHLATPRWFCKTRNAKAELSSYMTDPHSDIMNDHLDYMKAPSTIPPILDYANFPI